MDLITLSMNKQGEFKIKFRDIVHSGEYITVVLITFQINVSSESFFCSHGGQYRVHRHCPLNTSRLEDDVRSIKRAKKWIKYCNSE